MPDILARAQESDGHHEDKVVKRLEKMLDHDAEFREDWDGALRRRQFLYIISQRLVNVLC